MTMTTFRNFILFTIILLCFNQASLSICTLHSDDFTFTVTPVAIPANGGFNTMSSPQVNIKFSWSIDWLIHTKTGHISKVMTCPQTWNTTSYMGSKTSITTTAKADVCGTQFLPPASVFSSDNCDDCNCDSITGLASKLVEAYGCSIVKTLSLACGNGVQVPGISTSANYNGSYCQYSYTSEDIPFLPQPNPPYFCKCSLPEASPPSYAFPLCTTLNPAVAGENNCAPAYTSPNHAANQSTFYKAYARVTTRAVENIGEWQTPPNSGTSYTFSGGNSTTQNFLPNCTDPGVSSSNCINGVVGINTNNSKNPYVKFGFVSATGAIPIETYYPVTYLFWNNNSSQPNAPTSTNIAFTANSATGYSTDLYGIAANQFAEVAFDFANESFSDSSVCTLSSAGSSACPASNKISIIDNDGNTRTFGTYLPLECTPDGSQKPTQCDQFCVTEILSSGNTGSSDPNSAIFFPLGCFQRPLPTTITTSPCTQNTTPVPPGSACTGDAIPASYNSNSKWCLDYKVINPNTGAIIDGMFGRMCGGESLGSAQVMKFMGNSVTALLTDINYNQAEITTSNSAELCTGNSNMYDSGSSCPYGLYYDTTSEPGKILIKGSSVLCPVGLSTLQKCTECNCSSCTESNPDGCLESPSCQVGCNCIEAQQTYCPNSQVITTGNCPNGAPAPDPSPRPSDRFLPTAAPSYPPNSSNIDLFATLPPWQYFNSTNSPIQGNALRARTPLENGFCTPITPWDPVDCCQMFGPNSDFVQTINNGDLDIPTNSISIESFFDACQSFTCDYCTSDMLTIKSASGAKTVTDNDMFYIRETCNQIYQKCSIGSNDIKLIDPTVFSDSSLKTYFTNKNSTITAITSIYGANTICSFFQPGNADSSAGSVARCNVNDKVQDPTTQSWAYCGCFAPGDYEGWCSSMKGCSFDESSNLCSCSVGGYCVPSNGDHSCTQYSVSGFSEFCSKYYLPKSNCPNPEPSLGCSCQPENWCTNNSGCSYDYYTNLCSCDRGLYCVPTGTSSNCANYSVSGFPENCENYYHPSPGCSKLYPDNGCSCNAPDTWCTNLDNGCKVDKHNRCFCPNIYGYCAPYLESGHPCNCYNLAGFDMDPPGSYFEEKCTKFYNRTRNDLTNFYTCKEYNINHSNEWCTNNPGCKMVWAEEKGLWGCQCSNFCVPNEPVKQGVLESCYEYSKTAKIASGFCSMFITPYSSPQGNSCSPPNSSMTFQKKNSTVLMDESAIWIGGCHLPNIAPSSNLTIEEEVKNTKGSSSGWAPPKYNFCSCQSPQKITSSSDLSTIGYSTSNNINTGGTCGKTYKTCSTTTCASFPATK